MTTNTSVLLAGDVEIEARDRQGLLVETRRVSNLIVDYGIDLLARLVVRGFINDTTSHFLKPTASLAYIAVGTGTTAPTSRDTALETELDPGGRQRIEPGEVRIEQARLDLLDGSGAVALTLRAALEGAYGNRLTVTAPAASSTAPYSLEVAVDADHPYWNGTAWIDANPGAIPYEGADFRALVTAISGSPLVAATAPDLDFTGALAATTSARLAGGGGSVTVAATFRRSSSAGPVALSEAGLFTLDRDTPDAHAPLMFNRVTFPPITLSDELDITFRWRLSFQEATGTP